MYDQFNCIISQKDKVWHYEKPIEGTVIARGERDNKVWRNFDVLEVFLNSPFDGQYRITGRALADPKVQLALVQLHLWLSQAYQNTARNEVKFLDWVVTAAIADFRRSSF